MSRSARSSERVPALSRGAPRLVLGSGAPGAWRRPCTCAALALTAALLAALGGVKAQEGGRWFAGLVVTAYGEQEVDLATGVTTLPDGGEIVDRRHGLTLAADLLRFLEGSFIEAEGAHLDADFGTASAEELRVDLASGLLEARGGVRLERDGLALRGHDLRYDEEVGVAVLAGGVEGDGIDLSASALVVEVDTGIILLAGPYRYHDGPFELRSEREGSVLSLTPSDEAPHQLRASSNVSPELLERLGRHLP